MSDIYRDGPPLENKLSEDEKRAVVEQEIAMAAELNDRSLRIARKLLKEGRDNVSIVAVAGAAAEMLNPLLVQWMWAELIHRTVVEEQHAEPK